MIVVRTVATPSVVIAEPYRRKDISDARFGVDEKQNFLQQAHRISEAVSRSIFGQDEAALILQDRVVQYIEGFPNRKGEPSALNLIGLPGIGKTAMLDVLNELGFKIIFLNAQNFVSDQSDLKSALYYKFSQLGVIFDKKNNGLESPRMPVILVIDELDKVPEIIKNNPERTLPIIGDLNAILSEGVLRGSYRDIDMSNVLVITTMNFSSEEMQGFSQEVLLKTKNYYDFTLEDFKMFDQWIRSQPSARYKVLEKMFRSNTVSRLAPNTIIMQPLAISTYRLIVQRVAKDAIESATKPFINNKGKRVDKKIEVTIDESLIDFLVQKTVFAPSGARETIFRSMALMEQLINYGIKVQDLDGADSTADRPRKIAIGMDGNRAIIKVTPQVLINNQIVDKPAFSFEAEYNEGARLFMAPLNLTRVKPTYVSVQKQGAERPTTKKEILSVRFPPGAKLPPQTKDNINAKLIGQEKAVSIVLDDMRKYFGRSGPAVKEPSFRVLSGFPGIGKSELVRLVGEELKLPIVKINMQQYASDSPDVVRNFLEQLNNDINEVQNYNPSVKFILQLEELDKIFEINQMGVAVSRPIMAVVKDLLNDGQFRGILGAGSQAMLGTIDIRSAFTFVTMNFAVDRFGFSADPRLTTVEDVMKAWEELSMTPMATKSVLGSMFLPETVSRLMSRFLIMKPLAEGEYRELINRQIESVIKSRLYDQQGRNIGQIQIKLKPNYKKYLYNETVIPSEGARHTVVSVQSRISSDIEHALAHIPKKSKFATAPLILYLDFSQAKEQVIIRAQIENDIENDKVSKPEVIARRSISLQFPSAQVRGRVSAERLHIAAHEFGHAFMGVKLGLRFEHIAVVSPKAGVGGYVKFNDPSQSASVLIASVFSTLASRALERMVFSDKPLSPDSVMAISTGPSNDIRQATAALFNALYELGFDPGGGTIDRNFGGGNKYADFASIPHELAEKLGRLLREMEDFIIKDLLVAHSQDWYVSKIADLARVGTMSEKSFYDLIEHRYPGEKNTEGAYPAYFKKIFSKHILSEPKELVKSRQKKTKVQTKSVDDNINFYMSNFIHLLKSNFHGSLGKAEHGLEKQNCADLLIN